MAARLEQLKQERDETHAEVRRLARERDGYNAETQGMRAEYGAFVADRPEDWRDASRIPKPETPSAKEEAKLKERLAAPNPHEQDFLKARSAFHAAGDAYQAALRAEIPAVIEELDPQHQAAAQRVRDGFALIAEGGAEYAAVVERVRAFVIDCDVVTGRDLAEDGRAAEWARMAREALDAAELTRPGLTELGAWNVEHMGGERE